MKADQVALLARLAAKPVPDGAPEKAVYLSRLAWALHREGMTMDEIAKLFGVTRQRVSALLRE